MTIQLLSRIGRPPILATPPRPGAGSSNGRLGPDGVGSLAAASNRHNRPAYQGMLTGRRNTGAVTARVRPRRRAKAEVRRDGQDDLIACRLGSAIGLNFPPSLRAWRMDFSCDRLMLQLCQL
jgi:hypothetical protein